MASRKPPSSKSPSVPTSTSPKAGSARIRETASAGAVSVSQKATLRGNSSRSSDNAALADTIRRPRVAILIAEGFDSEAAETLYEGLVESGAVPLYVSTHMGPVISIQGVPLEAEGTLDASPPVLFEAVVVPGGKEHVTLLCDTAVALEFVKEQHRLSKPILALQEGAVLVEKAGLPAPVNTEQPDPLLFVGMHSTAAEALPDLVHAMELRAQNA